MMKHALLIILIISFSTTAFTQLSIDAISTDFVLYQRRVDFDKHMREKTINATFSRPLDSTTEDNYREACWAISQFMLRSAEIEKGFHTLFSNYATLEPSTKRALLEAIYGVYPAEYKKTIGQLISKETNPKLFAMQAVYLYRLDRSAANIKLLQNLMVQQFPTYQEQVLLKELDNYLQNHDRFISQPTPDISSIFHHQKITGQKTIYSFQRWNRDHPGLAVIQNADGRL